ncbi:MAG: hypothetical protein RR334_03255 [Clostridia bacterium]
MKEKEKEIIYYKDELNDEFSKAVIIPKTIDENYKYINDGFWGKVSHFFWYRCIAIPLAYLYSKITLHLKIKNKKVLKSVKNEGYFLFGNHTQEIGDALIPTLVSYPRTTYVIVHPNNLAIKFIGKLTPKLGALPLPGNLKSSRNFLSAVEKRVLQGNAVMIYPEAHIWPYYTKIRPFLSVSFKYPVKFDVPSFCITTTYQKRKHSLKPKLTTYVDGPFYPNKDLTIKEQQEELRNQIYTCMVTRSKNSTYEYIKYIKGDN